MEDAPAGPPLEQQQQLSQSDLATALRFLVVAAERYSAVEAAAPNNNSARAATAAADIYNPTRDNDAIDDRSSRRSRRRRTMQDEAEDEAEDAQHASDASEAAAEQVQPNAVDDHPQQQQQQQPQDAADHNDDDVDGVNDVVVVDDDATEADDDDIDRREDVEIVLLEIDEHQENIPPSAHDHHPPPEPPAPDRHGDHHDAQSSTKPTQQSQGADAFQTASRAASDPESLKRKHADAVIDTSDSECIICLEPWTSSGKHQLCCLRCGHLFGYSCIRAAIARDGARGKCPQCRMTARSKDIRLLFSSSVVVVDNERCEKLAQEHHMMRCELETERREKARLKEDRDGLLKEIRALKYPPMHLLAHLNVSAGDSARVGAYLPLSKRFIVSTFAAEDDHGIKIFDPEVSGAGTFLPIHKKTIRDCKMSPFCDSFMTVSLDKTLCMRSPDEPTARLTMNLDHPGWSCSYDMNHEHFVYAGLSNGTIQVYDIRNTKSSVQSLHLSNLLIRRFGQGIHSLHHIAATNSLIGGSLETPFFLHPNTLNVALPNAHFTITVVPDAFATSNCISVSIDPTSGTHITTWRSPASDPRPRSVHTLGQASTGFATTISFESPPLRNMSRSRMLNTGMLYAAVSDEISPAGVLKEAVAAGGRTLALPLGGDRCVMDFVQQQGIEGGRVGIVTERSLLIYGVEAGAIR